MSREPVRDVDYLEFGVDLLETYDLDPIYVIVASSNMPYDMKQRWVLAYCCYYHAGVASLVAESKSKHFYDALYAGLPNKWPRGMERRYFYGESAERCIFGMRDFGSPEIVVETMTCHEDFQSVSQAVQSFAGFGPWMAWKVGDLAERVLDIPVDFSNSELGIYKDPVQGAAFIDFNDKHYKITLDELHQTVDRMIHEFRRYKAPPYLDRRVNIQEIETILCKYKAHCYGFYPFGNDTIHVKKALEGWGDLADELLVNCNTYLGY